MAQKQGSLGVWGAGSIPVLSGAGWVSDPGQWLGFEKACDVTGSVTELMSGAEDCK